MDVHKINLVILVFSLAKHRIMIKAYSFMELFVGGLLYFVSLLYVFEVAGSSMVTQDILPLLRWSMLDHGKVLQAVVCCIPGVSLSTRNHD